MLIRAHTVAPRHCDDETDGHAWTFIASSMGKFVNGKFVEHWSKSDDLGMMQQLGLIPPPLVQS